MRSRLPSYTLLSLALLACISSPALAQDNRHDPKDLDAVVVRATPLARTAEDLALPVEVLAGERLDEARAGSLGETVNRLPGIQSSYFGPGVGRPVIRGLDGARVQVLNDGLGSGDVSTVSVDHAVTIEPFLANQIEVLKGPATLLYGSGAIGGAVNVIDGRIPEQATAEPLEGRAELRAGSAANERTGMLRLDGTSSSGAMVFHFDALHRQTGDYDIPGAAVLEHDHDGDDHGHDHGEPAYGTLPNSFVRTDSAALGISRVGERGFLGVSYSMFSTRYGVPGHVHPDHDDHDHDHDHDDHDHGHDDHDHDDVHVVMDQRRTEVRGGLDDLGMFESLRVKLARTEYTHTEYEGPAIGTVFDNDSLEGRIELAHRPLGGWSGAFGLQLSRRDFSAVGAEAFVPDSRTRDTGLFWIGTRSAGPFELELGARYDDNRITPVGQSARDFGASSLSAAARWNASDDFHLSLGLDRAQRSPGAEELYSDGLHVATSSYEFGDADLDLETSNRIELGVHWHRDSLRLGAAIYHLRYDDFIYQAETGIVDGGLPVRVWNQADARFTGAEADLDWAFAQNESGDWSLRMFADLVRGKLVGHGSRSVSFAVPHGDHSHNYTVDIAQYGNLPRIAPARLGTELRWRSPDGSWRAGAGAVRYASQDDVAEHEAPSPGYTLVNADLTWHVDRATGSAWEMYLSGNNLLNREARPHGSFIRDLAPLPGRNLSAGIRVLF